MVLIFFSCRKDPGVKLSTNDFFALVLIQIGRYNVCFVRVGEEKEDVERDLSIQRKTNS